MKTTQIKAIQGSRHEQMAHAEKARRLFRIIQDRIIDLQCLSDGTIMSNKTFRIMLKEHEEMNQRFEILKDREFRIKRVIWVNA